MDKTVPGRRDPTTRRCPATQPVFIPRGASDAVIVSIRHGAAHAVVSRLAGACACRSNCGGAPVPRRPYVYGGRIRDTLPDSETAPAFLYQYVYESQCWRVGPASRCNAGRCTCIYAVARMRPRPLGPPGCSGTGQWDKPPTVRLWCGKPTQAEERHQREKPFQLTLSEFEPLELLACALCPRHQPSTSTAHPGGRTHARTHAQRLHGAASTAPGGPLLATSGGHPATACCHRSSPSQ